MSAKTGIEWCDSTWNCIRGCSRVSAGCTHCYAESIAARFSGPGQAYEGLAKMTPSGPRWTGKVELVPDRLEDPRHWKKPRRVFVNSMSDLFHESLPVGDIMRVFGVMSLAPQHQFQILTKRPQRMLLILNGKGADRWCRDSAAATANNSSLQISWPLKNVWLGVSIEDQATADERIPLLLQTPAAVRFVSYEPALGPVDFTEWLRDGFPEGEQLLDPHFMRHGTPRLDQIITGGESGPGARPSNPNWHRSVRDQCQEAGVPYFFKQWGEWAPLDVAGSEASGGWAPIKTPDRLAQFDEEIMFRIGKKAAGRLLDGREWSEFPK